MASGGSASSAAGAWSKEEVDYTGLVNRVHRPDIFREVAKEMGVDRAEGGHEEGDALRRRRVRPG